MKNKFTETTTAIRTRWMIVDDNPDVLAVRQAILAHLTRADVECFVTSAEALAAFASHPDSFEYVVTDLEMPGMDGLELLRHLHAVSPNAKVLLTTGGELLTGTEARQKGFCGLLRKPFSVETLRHLLESTGILKERMRIEGEYFCGENSPRPAIFTTA
jgi:CheY-like chemotaxis protein